MTYSQILDLAIALRDQLAGGLSSTDTTLVTLEPTEVAPQLAAGGSAILILPPSREWQNQLLVSLKWELIVVSSQTVDMVEAWEQLDALETYIRKTEPLPETRPVTWDAGNRSYPALSMTFTNACNIQTLERKE